MPAYGYKLSYFAGDFPTVAVQDVYAERLFALDQQTEAKVVSRFTPMPVPSGVKDQWFKMINPIDGTTGRMDTVTSGLVAAIAAATAVSIQEVTRRFEETQLSYLTTKRRRMSTKQYRLAPFIERKDLKSEFCGIQQPVMEESVNAFNRKRDTICIAALDADVTEATADTSTGADTETTVTFDEGCNTVDEDASEGLNVTKIRQGYKYWDEQEVDYIRERPVLIIGPSQKYQVSNDPLYNNRDYNPGANSQTRELPTFVDAEIIVSNLLPQDDSETYTDCFLYLPSAMLYCPEEEFYISIEKRADRNDGVQILQEHASGALRLIDKRVQRIRCANALTEVS